MFITLGMAAEVVVVIQNKDLFVGAVLLALESLSRFAWQPGANTDHAMDINPARDDVAKTENEG